MVIGKGSNQVGTLKRAWDTYWGSNFNSSCSFINLYESWKVQQVLFWEKIAKERGKLVTHEDVESSYMRPNSFLSFLIQNLIVGEGGGVTPITWKMVFHFSLIDFLYFIRYTTCSTNLMEMKKWVRIAWLGPIPTGWLGVYYRRLIALIQEFPYLITHGLVRFIMDHIIFDLLNSSWSITPQAQDLGREKWLTRVHSDP